MALTFDIPALYAATFNYNSRAFEFEHKQQGTLGAPYYSVTDLGREYYLPVFLDDFELPNPVISIDGRKIIVETPMVERKGTVKEIINIDDYQIIIRGIITNKDRNSMPEETLTKMRELFEKNEAVTIMNVLTDIFLKTPDRKGYDKVVIKDFRIVPTPGVKNCCGYEMALLSDEAFSLIEV